MAVLKPVVTYPNSDSVRVTWSGVTESDTCEPYEGLSEYSDRSFQASGTFGGGISVALHGSNEYDSVGYSNGEFFALRASDQVAIGFTAAGGKQINEFCHAVKPVVTGGAAASLRLTVGGRRQRRIA